MILNLVAILLLAVWFYGLILGYVESGWPWLSLLGAVVIWLGLLARRV
jgi:membrane-bound ClpP family serine protease